MTKKLKMLRLHFLSNANLSLMKYQFWSFVVHFSRYYWNHPRIFTLSRNFLDTQIFNYRMTEPWWDPLLNRKDRTYQIECDNDRLGFVDHLLAPLLGEGVLGAQVLEVNLTWKQGCHSSAWLPKVQSLAYAGLVFQLDRICSSLEPLSEALREK